AIRAGGGRGIGLGFAGGCTTCGGACGSDRGWRHRDPLPHGRCRRPGRCPEGAGRQASSAREARQGGPDEGGGIRPGDCGSAGGWGVPVDAGPERAMTTVAIVHDYLTQRGGAERVVLSMLKAFPQSPLYTSLYEPDLTFPEFADA